MEIVYSKHAVDQMIKRQITTEDISLLIDDPDGNISQSRDKQIVFKKFPERKDNLIAAVVVLLKGSILEIITVMHYFEVKR